MLKHCDQLPSCTLLIVTFSVDWSLNEWSRRENGVYDRHLRLKAALSSRDSKVLVVAVKTGKVASADKDVMDERINALKRHLQLDSRTIVVLTTSEVAASSATMRRMVKSLRDFSTGYYNSQIKRARNMEKAVTVKNMYEGMLIARYNFKLSFFSEFLGQKVQATKSYKQCFQSLVEASTVIDEELIDQVKTLADFVNFKLCSTLLKTGSVVDAAQQFKAHINSFLKVHCSMPWRHDMWVSDQYIVFAQLLERSGITSAIPETDRSYFYQNAARHALKRQANFARTIVSSSSSSLQSSAVGLTGAQPPGDGAVADTSSTRYRGMMIVTPKYLGAFPQLFDPTMTSAQQQLAQPSTSIKFVGQYLEDREKQEDHRGMIMGLLKLAHDCIDARQKRRRASVRSLMADIYMQQDNYELAMTNLTPAAELLSAEGWVGPVLSLLRKKMACAVYLGRPREYLLTAMTLYSLACTATETDLGLQSRSSSPAAVAPPPSSSSSVLLTRAELEALHWDVMSVISSVGKLEEGGISGEAGLPSSSLGGSMRLPLTARDDFGRAAAFDQPPEYMLPHGYSIDMSNHMQMFNVQVAYAHPSVEVGQWAQVTVTIISLFFGALTFNNMSIHFSGDVLVKKFIHVALTEGDPGAIEDCVCNSGAGQLSDGAPAGQAELAEGETKASLVFPPNVPVTFSFYLFVPENCLGSATVTDAAVCVERIKLVMHVPSGRLSSSGSSAVTSATSSPKPDILAVASETTPDEAAAVFGAPPPSGPVLTASAGSDSMNSLPVAPVLVSPSAINAGSAFTVTPPTLERETSLSSTASWCNLYNPSSGYREIIFDVGATSRQFSAAREQYGKGTIVRELTEFVGPKYSPATLLITRPPAVVSLLSPLEPVVLLQGPVQRLNIVFSAGASDVKSARLYMSSGDFTPPGIHAALFWYPLASELEELAEQSPLETDEQLDAVKFYALKLNASKQPMQPICIPDQSAGAVFSVALFLRSEMQKEFRLKLTLEYVPKTGLTAFLAKEFEIRVTFQRPLQMTYNTTWQQDPPCGVLREGTSASATGAGAGAGAASSSAALSISSSNTVLMGHVFNMAATLTCVNSLNRGICLTGMLLQSEAALRILAAEDGNTETGADDQQLPATATSLALASAPGTISPPDVFRLVAGGISFDMLRGSDNFAIPSVSPMGLTSPAVELLGGESFVGSADIQCSSAAESSIKFPIQESVRTGSNLASSTAKTTASVGSLFLDWRLKEDALLKPVDLTPYVEAQKKKVRF